MTVLNFRNGRVEDCFQVQRIMPLDTEGDNPHCAAVYHVHALETDKGHYVLWADTATTIIVNGQKEQAEMRTELARIECDTIEECEHHFKYLTIKAYTASMEFNDKSYREEFENEYNSTGLD
jgi:hypothetical protein